MTSPTPDPTRLIQAASAVGTDKPQLALTLANSSITPSEMHVVGGYSSALGLAAANRLALDSGAATNFSASEQNQLSSINEPTPNQPPDTKTDHRSWFERAVDDVGGALSNTGSFLIHNPVSGFIGDTLHALNNAAHLPFRLASDAIDTGNDAEVNKEMAALGYNPQSASDYIAFMFGHGESLYHNLDGLRDQFDSKGTVDYKGNQISMVDLAVQMQGDPEGFNQALQDMDPQVASQIVNTTNSDEFKNIYSQVDQQHISPGRDIARLVTFGHTNNEAFHVLSGALDAAYTWFADPTIIGGKIAAGVHAADALGRAAEGASAMDKAMNSIASLPGLRNARQGIAGIMDQEGVSALLRVGDDGKAVTRVGKGWEDFLGQAKAFREAHAAHQAATTEEEAATHAATRAGIYANMQSRYGTLMPILDDVNGFKVPDLKAKFVTGGEVERADLTAAAHASASKNSMAGMSERERLQWGVDHGHTTDGEIADATPEGMTAIQQRIQQAHSATPETQAAATTAAQNVNTATFDGVRNTSVGSFEVEKGDPIESLDDLAHYLVSRDGLLRINNGFAARETLMMPGRLSFMAERRAALADTLHMDAGSKAKKWIDYSNAHKIMPHETEQGALDALDKASLTDMNARAQAGDDYFNLLKKGDESGSGFGLLSINRARARMERVNRRLTTMLPQFDHVDLTSADSVKTVNQFSRLYLNKGDSAMVSSAYAMGNLAERRQIVKGILMQSFHASGLSRSAAGKKMMDDYLGDQAVIARQKYGMGDSSVLHTDSGTREVALYQSQLTDRVYIPRFKDMNYLAAKYAVGGFASRTGIASIRASAQANWMDQVMGRIKLGWITSAAGGFRNALDEVAGFMAKGMGGDVLKARAVFSQVTKEMRATRRADSSEWLGMVAEHGGRANAREALNYQIGTARKEFQDAKLAAEQADRAHAAALVAHDAEDHPEVLVAKGDAEDAHADLADSAAELAHARNLENAIQYRIPLQFRRAGDYVNDKLIAATLGKLLSVRGGKYAITKDDIKYASELADQELTRTLRDGVFQSHYADDVSMIASDAEAMEIHRAGLQARKYGYEAKFAGYGQVEADGGAGLDSWAKYMQLRFADPTSPAHVWVQTLHSTNGDLAAAKQAVRDYMDEPAMRHFVNNAEVTNTVEIGGKGVKATTPELRAQALDQYADRVSADLLRGLASRGAIERSAGQEAYDAAKAAKDGGTAVRPGDGAVAGIQNDLLYQLAHSSEIGVPDRSWLASNVPPAERPEHTLGQLWAPYNGKHEPGSMPTGYTPMLTQAYQKVVTDQINALSRNPLMTALYVQARKNTLPYEKKLLEAGFTQEAAQSITKKISLSHAEQEAFKSIDNPYVASQFSTVARNLWAFERAQEDWLRRWGRTIRDNPQIIQQAQLLIHGGESTGLVDKDDQGNLQFVYPGSGLALKTFNKAFKAMGLGDVVQIPMTGELTSQLQFLNPSLDNPLGFSGTPLLSIPLKVMSATIGQHDPLLMSSLDTAVNGQLGAGRKWYESILPSWANRIMGGVLSEDPASKFGAAYSQALFNMDAAGQLDAYRDGDASAKARLQNTLSTQVHNNLLATALFGFFAPAAPTLNYKVDSAKGDLIDGDNESGYQGNTADWSAHIEGLHSLKDEYRSMVGRVGAAKANAWWAAVHPNELIYEQGGAGARTQVGTDSAQAPATIRAATWMQDNEGFLKSYGGKGGIATYFMPSGQAGTTDGQYSDVAYRAQIEDGMRAYKSLDQVFDDIVTARGEQIYYDAKQGYDDQISAAKAMGDNSTVSQLEDEWAQKKQEIYIGNPLLQQKNLSFATNSSSQQMAMTQLVKMVQDPSPEVSKAIGSNRDGILQLLDAYQQYNDGSTQLSGRRGPYAAGLRADLKTNYADTTTQIAQQFPELADLIRGVFRTPN